jgi:hypothetical protein
MNTFVLTAETADSSVETLLKQAAAGGVEVRDLEGNVLAYVLSPEDREAWTYAEANLELNEHRDEVHRALARRGVVTTKQLLAKATAVSRQTDGQ